MLLAAARDRGAVLGEAVRDPAADRNGRYGWDVPAADGTVVRMLMSGVELTRLRDDITAQALILAVSGGTGRNPPGFDLAPLGAWAGGDAVSRRVRLVGPVDRVVRGPETGNLVRASRWMAGPRIGCQVWKAGSAR
ncbi:hypothetical protein KRMM14A1259_57750 [Krasilnikovia sp. MM14-A1259]